MGEERRQKVLLHQFGFIILSFILPFWGSNSYLNEGELSELLTIHEEPQLHTVFL